MQSVFCVQASYIGTVYHIALPWKLTGTTNDITATGTAANPSSHLHPMVGTVNIAMTTIPIAPPIQKNCSVRYDAVEAHSCVDIVAKFTDEQYTTINSCVLCVVYCSSVNFATSV